MWFGEGLTLIWFKDLWLRLEIRTLEDVACFALFALTNIYPVIYDHYAFLITKANKATKSWKSSKHKCYNILMQKCLHRIDLLESKEHKCIFKMFTWTIVHSITHLKSDWKQAIFMNPYESLISL